MRLLGNANRVYKIGGYDVTNYVIQRNIPSGMQTKPEWGGLPETPRLEFELANLNGEFSTRSERSIFRGVKLQDTKVEVTFKQGSLEEIEWTGFIENASEDYKNRTTQLTGISPFSKLLDSPAKVSLGAQTPATLSKNVFVLFNIPINELAYASADALHENLVTAQVDPNILESRITLMELQKQLAAAGYGRIYPVDGEMVYEVFQGNNPSIFTEVNERDLMAHPIINSEENNARPYRVNYIDGEVNSIDFNEGEEANSLDFGPNAPVKLNDLSSAQQVADQWEEIDKIETRRVEFAVKHDIGRYLSLNSFIEFTWKRVGFINETLEIVGIDRTDPRYTKLIGRTLP